MERSTLAAWRQAVPLMAEGYHTELLKKVEARRREAVIYPPQGRVLAALRLTSFDAVKVVIVGQDPYHGKGQAHGLCFSVQDGVKPPPSLVNIFKEIRDDLGISVPDHGNLTHWANQGVFLLNATLTVRAGQPGSHQNKGWEHFTNAVISKISNVKSGVVFLLWGRYAQAKESLIDASKHFIFKAPHPSPFSANNGFFGCKHFSKTNEALSKMGMEKIEWAL